MMFIRAGKNAVRASYIEVQDVVDYSLLAGGRKEKSYE
jgi:hypothetical protein